MDCEKFETLLIDELYGELDEVTSAAVRRHAAGCARCGALLSGLRATRKVAAVPMEEPSSDLEDRILSAVREQQKVLPFRARFATALSRAGAWAMRPQTAMAAVFLVVIGTSFVLVQSRKSAAPAAAANAEGSPVTAQAATPAATASALALESRESAFAHGVQEKQKDENRPSPTTSETTLAANDLDKTLDEWEKKKAGDVTNAGPIGGAATVAQGMGHASAGSGGGGIAPQAQAEMARGRSASAAEPPPSTPGSPSFRGARDAYDARRYDDAKQQFDQLAPTDPNASLWAGRAEKAKNGCDAAAIARFEAARSRAPSGSAVANEATLEAARCYRAVNDTERARARYAALLSQAAYRNVAQNELDQMAPAAARKAAPAHHSRAVEADRPAATATATPQAAPAEKAATY